MKMAVKALTGLAVHARSLEWAVRNKTGDKPTPDSAQSLELDLGQDQKTLLGALQTDRDRLVAEIRDRCGRLPAPAVIGIPASWVLLRIAELPSGSPDEMKSMAELQVDKFSPFPVDESAISYELLAEADGRCRLLLSAVRTDSINLLADGLRAAGLQPKWVDINLLGWWQLIKDAGKAHPAGAQVHLILDGPACDMIVTSAGTPVAMRSLSGMEDLAPGEADEEIARETAYTLASLDLDRHDSPPAEITVWHKGDPPAELLKRFTEQYSIGARPESLESLPPLVEGLLRRADRRAAGTMDLAPTAWMEAETAQRTRRQMIVSSLLVAGVWLTGMVGLFGGIQYQKQRLASLERQLAELKEPAEKVRGIRDRCQELIKYMDRSRSGLECLREISDRLPPGIELKSFSYHKNKSLEITGDADSYALATDFKKGLEQSELFVATELPRTRHSARGEDFKIICTLPGGEKP